MKVENVKVYDLEESLAAARYPMIADLKEIDLTLGIEKEHSLERGLRNEILDQTFGFNKLPDRG